MTAAERTYRLTATGKRALESEKSVPAWYRVILGLLLVPVTSSEIIGAVSAHSRGEVLMWLGQLETLGFIELIVPASSALPAELPSGFGFDVVLAGLRAA